jgi:FkbM family methyltransferase
MNDRRNAPIVLDPTGFNELRMCRTGPMLYNKHDIYIGGSLQKYGEFSVGEQDVFSQIVGPGAVVVEVGANIGAHTVELARLAGRDGEVHAFEPQRIVFQALCANLALNQRTNVFARQAAVGAKSGTIAVPHLDPSARDNFGGVSLREVTFGESVPLIALDSLDLPACHLLKVDVEGMEVDVLKGGEQLIETHRPIMYIENDRVERSEELLRVVERLRYNAYWHLPRIFNPENYFGDAENVFGDIESGNILCVPSETQLAVAGLRQVQSVHERWNALP